MVALKGSDLFWVPCDCTKCAATHSSAYASALASVCSLSSLCLVFCLVTQVKLFHKFLLIMMIVYRVWCDFNEMLRPCLNYQLN